MYEQYKAEIAAERAPKEVEFMHVEIPDVLRVKLTEARKKAVKEVKPE
jgi:hypothetical protein